MRSVHSFRHSFTKQFTTSKNNYCTHPSLFFILFNVLFLLLEFVHTNTSPVALQIFCKLSKNIVKSSIGVFANSRTVT